MINKNKLIKESIFQKRGFYLALYSTIGIIMLGSVYITYSTISSLEKNKKRVVEVDFNKMQNTIKNNNKSYKQSENVKELQNNKNLENSIEKNVDKSILNNNKDIAIQQKEPLIIKPKEEEKENIAKEVQIPKKNINNSFSYFGEEDEMNWPINGEIVMNYSINKFIYDKTLDQFRTNDNIKISAEVGNKVRAAADGKVKSIENNKEEGNKISIEHGNGWVTTYSQLGKDIKVSKGDIVSKGEIIASVGEPTIYTSSLGSHLCFKVTKENVAIDPSKVLVE